MKIIVGLIISILILMTHTVYAEDNQVAGQSALISLDTACHSDNSNIDLMVKRKAIKNVLERYNSPLIDEVDTFMLASKKYNLDAYLLPSIAGLESQFGRVIYPGTYNGFGWGGGMMYFANWEESILTVGKGLRENYMDKGATDVYAIGHIYAPPSTTWASKVTYFMAQFEAEEARIKSISIAL